MTLTFEQLPPKILDYMGSLPATTKNVRLASRYALTGQQLGELATVISNGFLQKYSLEELPIQLKEQVSLEDSLAFQIAADVTEQHFGQFPEFFDQPQQPLIEKWHQWASQLGVKVATPLKQKTSKNDQPRRSMEFTHQKSIQTAPRSATPTVGQQITARRQAQVAQGQVRTQTQVTPESRLRFLAQVRGLTVDALRQGGQSADGRIQQVGQKISQVLQGAPGERAVIGQALKQSPLFSLYQQLGQETIRTGQPIDMVIYQRYQQNQPYLLTEEFDAVAQLVKEIS
ncbi:MAG: hypothetical protein U0517_03820 [Candidatus Andersenbacteria bacterium]